MSPLFDRRSHGLRPVCDALISDALQQCGKKFLVESDSHNRAGPPPDWGPPRSRTGQPLKVVADFNLVSPGMDLLVAHATSVEKMLTHGSFVYETQSRSLPLYVLCLWTWVTVPRQDMDATSMGSRECPYVMCQAATGSFVAGCGS